MPLNLEPLAEALERECPQCQGQRRVYKAWSATETENCAPCNGTGAIPDPALDKLREIVQEKCFYHGTRKRCLACNGTNHVLRTAFWDAASEGELEGALIRALIQFEDKGLGQLDPIYAAALDIGIQLYDETIENPKQAALDAVTQAVKERPSGGEAMTMTPEQETNEPLPVSVEAVMKADIGKLIAAMLQKIDALERDVARLLRASHDHYGPA